MKFIKFLVLLFWCAHSNADPLSFKPVPFIQVEGDRIKIENVYELVSSNKQFGGISGLKIKKNIPLEYINLLGINFKFSPKFYLLSDQGYIFKTHIEFDQNHQIKVFNLLKTYPLLSAQNTSLVNDKYDGDAEAIDIKGREVFVAFERNHRIIKYQLDNQLKHIAENKLKNLEFNQGIESLRLVDRNLLFITENSPSKKGYTKGAYYNDDQLISFHYQLKPHFYPTELIVIKNKVIVLERKYIKGQGNELRLVYFNIDKIKPDAMIDTKELIHLKPPFPLDNFEAMDYLQMDKNNYKIFIFSDNNFNPKQKNLLLVLNYID